MRGPGNSLGGIEGRISYANVMSTLAVFLALGGTTLAVTLPRKSVGPKQLKSNAVREKKIKDAAVSEAKIADTAVTAGKLGAGAVTAPGLAGGAVTTEKLANASVTQQKISPSAIPLLGTLRPGQTLRGSFHLGARSAGVDDNIVEGVSYAFPLPNTAPSTVIGLNDLTTPNCPSRNPPQAAIGRLCLYVNGVSNIDGSTVSTLSVGTLGFGIRADSSAASGDFLATGVWAVTPSASPNP